MTTYVFVNRNAINNNKKTAKRKEPVLTVQDQHGNQTLANHVKIHGDSEVVYKPDDPVFSGIRVWIECQGKVEILD